MQKKQKLFFCVWGNLDKRIALNATNKAIINCLQACKQLDFAKAQQIARTSSDSLLLQRIIDQYQQEVDEALYDADGIYQLAKDDPVFKQLTPAARKQLKKNEQQRNTLNTHLRSRAAIKNSLMERWHIDQSAPPSVHRALYELMDDQHSKHTPYAITKIAAIANSPETIKAFYLPNGVLKGFGCYAGTKLIPASVHLLTPEAAPLRVLLNQAVYEHHEHQTALANAMLQTMSQLMSDMNTYGPLFGTQWPQLPEEPLIDDVESIYDCIDNIRRMGYPHLAHTLNTMCEYSEGFSDGTQEHTHDVGSYVCEHPVKSAALAGGATICCYAVSAFPLAMGSLKVLAVGESFASLTKPSETTNPYDRGKEHAHYALDMFSQYKVLKKVGACYKYSHELASRLFDKLERALSNGISEPIDVTYQPILELPKSNEMASAAELSAPEPLPILPVTCDTTASVEPIIETIPNLIITPEQPAAFTVQVLPKTRELIKKYIKYDHTNKQLEAFLASKIHDYVTEYNRPKCATHQKPTRNGKHLEIPLPIRSAAEQNMVINTVRAYNFTALTPKKCGPQKGMWFDYDHVFGPSALINCNKNTRECVGFHHDYQGKNRNSGLLEFHIVKEEGLHGIYEANWSYCNALLKGSTFFPDEWTFKKVLEKIIEASKNIQSCKFDHQKNIWKIQGLTIEQITIEIILEADPVSTYPTGKITTAYPIIKV